MEKDEKNHRDHGGKDKSSLCSQEKEFPLKEITEKIILCSKIYEAQLLTYLRATEKRVGLLLNFNVERLKDGIKRMVL